MFTNIAKTSQKRGLEYWNEMLKSIENDIHITTVDLAKLRNYRLIADKQYDEANADLIKTLQEESETTGFFEGIDSGLLVISKEEELKARTSAQKTNFDLTQQKQDLLVQLQKKKVEALQKIRSFEKKISKRNRK